MKTLSLLASVVLFASSTFAADTFCLTGKDGKEHGPFELKDGAPVQIEKQTFTVNRVLTHEQRVTEWLKAVEVPKFEFKDAPLDQVFAFFQDVVRKAPVTGTNDFRKLTFVVDLAFGGVVPTNVLPATTNAPSSSSVKTVSVSAEHMSLHSALTTILAPLGLKFLVRNDLVLLVSKNAPESPLVTRMYIVLSSYQEKVAMVSEDAARSAQSYRDEVKDFFATVGVPWPEGSSILYLRSTSHLFVCNTAENLAIFEKVLARLNVVPNQIEIEAQFVEFNATDIAAMAVTNMVNVDSLMRLRQEGKGRLLAAPKVVTQAGKEATVKSVVEYIYPTDFEVVFAEDTNAVSTVTTGVVEPCGFQTREVGAILQVTPDVNPEGTMINLTMMPQFVRDPTWKDFGTKHTDAKGKETKIPMEQPFFATDSVATSIAICNGAMVVVGGGMPNRDKDKFVYLFVSARLVGPDGKPLVRDGRVTGQDVPSR